MNNPSLPITSPPCSRAKVAKAVSISPTAPLQDVEFDPKRRGPPPARPTGERCGDGIGRVEEEPDDGRRGRPHAGAPAASARAPPFEGLTPVRLPPGRLRLATNPRSTGSTPTLNTTGIVVVAALAATAAEMPGHDHGNPSAHQIGRERRQTIVTIVAEGVFDCHVPALGKARLRCPPGFVIGRLAAQTGPPI